MSGQPRPVPKRGLFGAFEFDETTGELRKHGIRVRLQGQPLQILSVLIREPGRLVTRDELQQELWKSSTFVDFEHGLHAAMNRLRQVLGDSADQPRYIETLPGRGYRFIETVDSTPSVSRDTAAPQPRLQALPVTDCPGESGTSLSPIAEAVTPSKRILSVAVVVTLVCVTAAAAWWAGRNSRSSQAARFELLSFRRGFIQAARFTKEGRAVIYAASWDGQPLELFSSEPGNAGSRSLDLPATGLLAVTPAGAMAVLKDYAFRGFYTTGTMAEILLAGGAPHPVLERVQFADWTRDGKSMAVTVTGEAGTRLEFPRGRVLFSASGGGWPGDPRIAPNGELIAFADHPYPGDDGSVAIVDLHGRKRTLTPVFDTLQGIAWSPSGKEIWFTAAAGGTSKRRLQAVTLEGSIRDVAGVPGNLKLHDIAGDGRVLLTKEDSSSRVYFLGAGDSAPRDLTWLEWAGVPILSTDGKTVLMTENDQSTSGKNVIYLRGTDGSPAIRVGKNVGISLSPDGRWVATSGVPEARPDIVLLPVGPGEPIRVDTGSLQLTGSELPNVPGVGWLPDSKTILYAAKEPGRPARTYAQDVRGGHPRPVTPEKMWGWLVTPDGSFLLARDSQSHAFLFSLRGDAPTPLPFLSPKQVVLRFSADGSWLYIFNPGERPPRVRRVEIASGRTEIWKEIPFGDPAGIVSVNSVQITPDGKSLAYRVYMDLSELYVAYGLR